MGFKHALLATILLCLGVHAFAFARWFLFFSATIQIDGLVAAMLVVTTVIGMISSIIAIRREGLASRVLGTLGVLWFGFYILLAIAES